MPHHLKRTTFKIDSTLAENFLPANIKSDSNFSARRLVARKELDPAGWN
jgi:hypothetical protein